jgi:uncharacterized membrane protein
MTTTDSATTAIPSTAGSPATSATNTLSVVSLVLGIAGILLGQALVAIAAIVLGFVARTREPQAITTANWGLVLGFVGLFGGFVLGILAFFGLGPILLLGSLPFWDFWGYWG